MTTTNAKSAFADRSERELVLSVVRDDFGATAEQIALALLRADGLRLVEIVARVQAAATGIRPSETEVKANLLKLLQHNLLRIAPVATPRGTAASYSINVAEVLYRLRFPKFTELAKEAFGVEGEIIMEEILVHGRVRMDQSIDAMAFSLAEHERQQDAQRGADDEISESELDENRDRIREAFVEMAKKRYVSRVHPLDMKLPEPEETPDFPASIMRGQETDSISTAPVTKMNGPRRNGTTASKAGTTSAAAAAAPAQDDDGITVRGGKRKKPASDGGNNVPIELQMMLEADVSAAKSRGPDDGEAEFETEQERQSKKRKAGGGGGAKRAKLPSRGAASAAAGNGQTDSEDSETTGTGMAESSLVWRCGVDQLLRDLRHRACIKFATENFNHVAGVIVKAMLAHSSPHERHHNEPLSHPVTARELFAMDDVKAALPNNVKDTWRLLLNYVTVMCRDKSGMVMKTAQEQFDATLARAGDGGQYVVHMKKIVEFLRQSTTHSYVQEKYGVQSARIVRLLMEKRQLEEKPIGELALLPPNDARRRLYELYREGLTKLQEIPKRADHNPSFTLFCWSVDVPQMEKRIAQRIQDSLTKLRRRRKAEADENKDLIARSDQLVEANDLAKFDKLSRALDRLDRAIIHLDNMLMLYRDF